MQLALISSIVPTKYIAQWGPGLLESVYHKILAHELKKRGLNVDTEVEQPVLYEGIQFEFGFRMDIVVENKVIVEVKSVEELHPVHFKQLLTYLKLSKMKLGYLINFNEELIKDGIHRVVNGL
jgi:GxxExxY protein